MKSASHTSIMTALKFNRCSSLSVSYQQNCSTLTKTTQQFGQNEFIAQCENCLTKYWTINKNATKKKKLIKNTLFKGGSGGKRLRLVSGSDKR